MKIKLLGIYILIANLCVAFVNAAEMTITKRFYQAKNVPTQYRAPNLNCPSDCTVFFIENCKGKTVNIREEGVLIDQKKKLGRQLVQNGRLDLAISSIGYFPGFPVKYIFSDLDSEKEIEFVPNPIYVKSSVDGVQIDAQVILMSPATYRINFSNLKEDEEISMTSISYDETLTYPLILDEHNAVFYSPAVVGKRGGVAQLSFKRSTGEVLKLELPWGLEWQKYVILYDQNHKPKRYIDTKKFCEEFPADAKYFDSKSK